MAVVLLIGMFASMAWAQSPSLYETVMAGGELPEELTTEQQAELYDAYKADGPTYVKFTIDNLWILIAACLVFIMHLGFATVESGLTQSKNTVNVLFKNLWIICIGLITYYAWGFNLMYPGFEGGWFGFAGFGIPGIPDLASWGNATAPGYALDMTTWTDFLFQAMFAATAATIVSGAVAERIKLPSFMVFSILLVGISYPITGSWKWGGGWLDAMGFYDFAGSTIVHSVGGWAALVLAFLLGPRRGKYLPGGRVRPILGHSMPLAMIGVMLLWLGWFGFNGGSVLSADPVLVSFVMVTTAIAAAAGGIGAMLTSWIVLKKPDLSMSLNGVLAGLVGITAGADVVSVFWALVIGFIAGIIVVFSVIFLDKVKIDDPVGAISVHLTCGIWGTLAAAIGSPTIVPQLVGIVAIGAWTILFSLIFGLAIRATMGLRVSQEEEMGGLDVGEHGQEAYPDFAPSTSR